MSKLQQSTFFHGAVDSSEQTGRLINAGTVNLDQELHSLQILNCCKQTFTIKFPSKAVNSAEPTGRYQKLGIVNLEQELHS